MHSDFEAICNALDALAAGVKAGWSGDQTFCEAWGWNCPTITRHDVSDIATRLAQDIRDAAPDAVPATIQALVSDAPRRLKQMQVQTIPQFWGGNNGQAVAAYTATLSTLREALVPVIGWQLIPDSKIMPGHLARRLRSIQAELDQLLPNKERISTQLADITSAHAAAESLPIDLKALAEARDVASSGSAMAASSAEKAKSSAEEAAVSIAQMRAKNEEAQKLVAQCEEAYRITTTKGLAAAFDQRATRLARSMWVWVCGLLSALGAGTYLGANRFELLTSALADPKTSFGHLVIQLLLALLSVAAPVWFAWIATKQIGQRFRLSEDYGFKASVAKAYEGYRREAARIDEAFEHRLFGSALTRLEEAPLRLVEMESHGSPWSEFVNSSAFGKALDKIPDFKLAYDKVLGRTTRGHSSPQDGQAEKAKPDATQK